MLTFFDKAIVAFIMPFLSTILGNAGAGLGLTAGMDWETAVTMVLTAAITYAVPGFGKTLAAFVVPAIVSSIAGVIKGMGITGALDWKTVITMVLTGLLTHFVPNKPAPAK